MPGLSPEEETDDIQVRAQLAQKVLAKILLKAREDKRIKMKEDLEKAAHYGDDMAME